MQVFAEKHKELSPTIVSLTGSLMLKPE